MSQSQAIQAIFQNGVFRPLAPVVGLQEGQRIRVTILEVFPPHPLLKHCGTLPDEDAAEIQRIIDGEFKKIDPDDWK